MAESFKELVNNGDLPEEIVSLGRLIWLAGLGAYGKIEGEGSKLFDSLVEEGKAFEARLKKSASGSIGVIKDKVGVAWDRVEQLFEESIGNVLKRFAVPTNEDIRNLSRKVDALQDSLKSLAKL